MTKQPLLPDIARTCVISGSKLFAIEARVRPTKETASIIS